MHEQVGEGENEMGMHVVMNVFFRLLRTLQPTDDTPLPSREFVIWRSACKADPLWGIDRRVKWTHRSRLVMLEVFDLQDQGEGCLRWTITDGFSVLIAMG